MISWYLSFQICIVQLATRTEDFVKKLRKFEEGKCRAKRAERECGNKPEGMKWKGNGNKNEKMGLKTTREEQLPEGK